MILTHKATVCSPDTSDPDSDSLPELDHSIVDRDISSLPTFKLPMPLRRGRQPEAGTMPQGDDRDHDSPTLVSSSSGVSSVSSMEDTDGKDDTPSTPRINSSHAACATISRSRGSSPHASESKKVHQANEQFTRLVLQTHLMWSCRVCGKDPVDPVTTLCGHIFCHRYGTTSQW